MKLAANLTANLSANLSRCISIALLALAVTASAQGYQAADDAAAEPAKLASKLARAQHHSHKIVQGLRAAGKAKDKSARALYREADNLKRSFARFEAKVSCKALAGVKAKKQSRIKRNAVRSLKRSVARLHMASKRLSAKSRQSWRKISGDKRIARMSGLLKPFVAQSFRRVGNCVARPSVDARTSERMVVI